MRLLDLQEFLSNQQEISDAGKSILSTDGDVIFYRNFFSMDESNDLFAELCASIQWRQDLIQIFDKAISLPRLTAWYGDEGKSYAYSGIQYQPEAWTSALSFIKARIEKAAETQFNSVLLNLYRNGKDSVSWHSDDEPELGQNPTIASVSLGETRRFSLKHKQIKGQKIDIDLPSGSLLLMRGETQHFWLHQVAKTTRAIRPRINLTFRTIHDFSIKPFNR